MHQFEKPSIWQRYKFRIIIGLLILVAVIAVALSVGLYFGLKDDSPASRNKNSTTTSNDGTGAWLSQIFPEGDENDTASNELSDESTEDKAEVDPLVESTTKSTTKATTTTATTTKASGIQNVGFTLAPRKFGCFSGCLANPNESTNMLCNKHYTDKSEATLKCLGDYKGNNDIPQCVGYISYRVDGENSPRYELVHEDPDLGIMCEWDFEIDKHQYYAFKSLP